MRVLVTGASGFLGGRVAERLASEGHTVRGLVRDPRRWAAPPPGSETVVGDVTDGHAVQVAVRDCEAVVHAAALVKPWARDRASFDRVNVGGLEHVADATRAQGARLVHVSSFVALGPTDGATFDESSARVSTEFHNDYERTKYLADRLARELGQGGLDVVRLYPGVVFGPGALTEGNHVIGLLLQHARGKLPGMLGQGDLRQCFAYIDDVAAGIVRALGHAPAGAGYILGGENRTAIELFAEFQRAAGVAPPRRRIPFGVASLIGRLQRLRADWFGVEPELTDEVVGIYRHEWAYSSAKAERELDYRITPFGEAVERSVDWLRRTGEL